MYTCSAVILQRNSILLARRETLIPVCWSEVAALPRGRSHPLHHLHHLHPPPRIDLSIVGRFSRRLIGQDAEAPFYQMRRGILIGQTGGPPCFPRKSPAGPGNFQSHLSAASKLVELHGATSPPKTTPNPCGASPPGCPVSMVQGFRPSPSPHSNPFACLALSSQRHTNNRLIQPQPQPQPSQLGPFLVNIAPFCNRQTPASPSVRITPSRKPRQRARCFAAANLFSI